jgi:hypothetical protein
MPFSFLLGWSGFDSNITEATTGLLYQPQMVDDDECGAGGGMLGSGNRSTRRKTVPLQHCPPQIPHNQTRARTGAAAVESWQLQPDLRHSPAPIQYTVWRTNFKSQSCCVHGSDSANKFTFEDQSVENISKILDQS